MTNPKVQLIKGGVMRKMFALPVVLSMLAIPASVVPTTAGPRVGFSVEFGSGYIGCNDFEEDMDWDNLIVINNDRIGFWLVLPSGMCVFHCRNMWYDNGYDEWRYGPWWDDYTMSYGRPYHGVSFHIYMERYYPRYHARYFYHDNGHYYWNNHREYNRRYERDDRHSDYHAPRMKSVEPAVNHETHGAVRDMESNRTTVTIRSPSAPVRTDGGSRLDRTDRFSSDRSNAPVVRERSATRVQPSSNGTRGTRTETRAQNRGR
jgi:hypothetical protein